VFENPCIWPFVRNACMHGNIKAAPVVCGGNNEPCVSGFWFRVSSMTILNKTPTRCAVDLKS
jgi:hypothetical protein